MMATSYGGAQWRRPFVTGAAREFHQIQKFVAACRRQWPGAKICLRPDHDDAPASADAPPNNPEPETEWRFK